MEQLPTNTIHTHFANLDDPRVERTKAHPLLDIVTIAICGVICGADTWVDIEEFGKAKYDWLRTLLAFPNGIPSHDTFGRVFAALDAEQFQQCFLAWVEAISQATQGEVIAVDGKTLRRSHDRGSGKDAMHMVSAWAARNRLVVGQRKVDDTSNEMTAIPMLLKVLDLQGCTVTIDALGCQTAIAEQMVTQGADYVLALKDNQEQLHTEVQATFRYAREDDFRGITHDRYRTVDGGHGRLETRHYWTLTDPECLAYLDPNGAWTGLTTLGMVDAERCVNGKTTREQRYYLLSADMSARAFAEAVRGHWEIENCVHWVLDVTFREDDSRVRIDNAAQNFAVLRHIALNLLRREPSTGSINTKRLRAGWDTDYLRKVLRA